MARAKDILERKSREEALSWFVKINSGDATEAEHEAHRAWLAVHPQNRQEYAKLDVLWSDLDSIPDPREQPDTSLDYSQTNNAGRTTDLPHPESFMMSRRGFVLGGAMTASAAGYVAINGLPNFLISDHTTGIGEQRDITLADGSGITLDADTAIDLKFTDAERRVRLLRGRAFFDVASDRSRPFVVEAAGGTATALGTRFTVHQWDGTVTVSVEESAVAVSVPNSSETKIGIGEYVSYGRDGLDAVGTIDANVDAAWRRGKLMFEDRPLRQVIADINRYRPGVIYITDNRLLDLRVSGIFDMAHPDDVLSVIQKSLPVQAIEMTRYLVLLRPVG